MELSEPDRAWLAAWIDGEGSVMLNKRTYSGRGERDHIMKRHAHYRPVVVVACFTFEPLRDALAVVVPGQVYQHRVGGAPDRPRARSQWTYRWNVTQIAEFLPQVLPRLVIKVQQATLLLDAMKIKAEYRNGVDLTAYRASLDEIYTQIRALNTRGRTVLEEVMP